MERDPKLWEQAKKRAGFKRHFTTYIIINIFLWVLWYFKGMHTTESNIPWPLYTTLGWGVGIIFHYFGVYMHNGETQVEKEYNRLLNEKK